MNKKLKNHAKLERLKRDINAKKTKSITYNDILNNLRIGWIIFYFCQRIKKSIVANWLEKTRKTCRKLEYLILRTI